MSAADRSHLARSFDAVAGEYDRGRPTWPRPAVDWLLGEHPLDVLDVGAGTGKLTEVLVAAGHRVTAVEPMPRMRAELRARLPQVPVLAATAEDLPLPDDGFDAVLAAAAFHWFDADAALAQFARVLRPGGVVALLGNVFDVSVPWIGRLRRILGPPAAERRDYWPPLDTLARDFASVEEKGFPHSQEIDLQRLRDLASSRSGFAVMDEAGRARQLARVDALWAEDPELAAAGAVQLRWIARGRRCKAPLAAWRVRNARADEVLALRAAVLRPGASAMDAVFSGDGEPGTVHLAVDRDGTVVGVVTALAEPLPDDPGPGDWRVRGMAVAAPLRGRGIGAALLSATVAAIAERGGRRVWCNARVGAVTLYERAAFERRGERFELAAIGEHFRMVRELD